jgi:glycosyltransferase involved in cell wall biosynthesis
MPLTSVIVPAYNEEKGLPLVLRKLCAAIDDTYEVIVVDDGSTDGTPREATRFPCRVVFHSANRGKADAVRSGIKAARGENLIIIDADDTYPAELVPEIARQLDGAEMVVASRVGGADRIPFVNRLGNWIFRQLIRRLYGFKPSDPLTGMYGIKKARVMEMRLSSGGFGIETEMAVKSARLGLTTIELPIEYRPRVGQAKLRPMRDGYNILRTVMQLVALYNPMVSFIFPGLAIFLGGTLLMAVLLFYPISVAGVGLDQNTYILSAIAALSGFHLGTLGFGLSLYASAHKLSQADIVTSVFMTRNMGAKMGSLGLVLLVVGICVGASLGAGWISGGLGEFEETKAWTLAGFLAALGLQMALSTAFLTIFVNELKWRED